MKKFTELTLAQYLEELSSSQPVPGGGSVSAYVASMAMGLTQMVGRVSLGRKKKPGLGSEEEQKEQNNLQTVQKVVDSLEKTKKDAFQIVDLDPEIFDSVMKASGNPEQMEDALQNSFRLQADLALLIVMAREGNSALADLVKGSIKNDLLVSAALYGAAFQGAYHTALINVKYMKNPERKQHAEKALQELQRRFERGNPDGR
ncbi:MAG: hypothetical protein EXS63_05755 [Candidatus Omnitrophica bacterium]|nr:hypothetical protein [Candidatus Omnitrophota bacterium]